MRHAIWALAAGLGCVLGMRGADCEELTAVEIIEQADARIREYRTADLTIEVVDAQGQPVEGAQVEVRQVRHAFLFGSNIFAWAQPTAEDAARYRDQYAALLNYATLPFYWRGYEPEPGQPQHESREEVARWCRDQGIVTKGHPLVWNHIAGTPAWLPEDPAEITRLSDARVTDIVGRFRGHIDRWDVVNEAADPFRTGPEFDGRLTEAWQHFGKLPLTLEPFRIARRANPEATLLINDYRVDPEYEKVIEALVDEQGRPLYDVIGIQSHMHGGVWSPEKTWHVCETFARFGVPLHFTETTVVSGPKTEEGWESTPEGEQRQADEVEQFYTVLFSHPAVEAITWWDFADRNAWMGAPAGFLRKDLSPKPAYNRLLGLIKGKWWTHTTGTTTAGTLTTRTFYGDYEITVRHGGQERSARFELRRGGEQRVQVQLP